MHQMNKRNFCMVAVGVAIANLVRPGFAETPPPIIHLAGPGNAAGTPYGNSVLGVLRVKKILEDEFSKEKVKIDWQFLRGTGPAINEAFANRQLDFANYGGLPNIVGKGAGLDTRVLASNGTSPVYMVARKGSNIKTLADLKGKKISVSRGTIYEWSLDRILTEAKLDEKDIQIFDLESADQVSAFTGGDIDAIVAGNNLLDLVDRGLGETIYTTKGHLGAGTNFGSFIVRGAFEQKYPETTQRVVNAYVEAAYYSSQDSHRDELYDIWALTGVPKKAIAKDFDGESLRDRMSPLLDGFYLSNVESGIKFSVTGKLIKAAFDPSGWIDSTYLKNAIQKFGYDGFWRPHDQNGNPQG
jgi:sulfonate transport system substrate-binding protein